MYTQCPQCKTLFRVAAQQLGAAQGQVRCSKCLAVFNALQQLYEQLPSHLREEFLRTPERRTTAPPAPETKQHASPEAELGAKPLTATAPEQDSTHAPSPSPGEPAPRFRTEPAGGAALPVPQVGAAAVVEQPSAWATGGWSLGIVLLLIVLAGQWVWIMREDLAGYPVLRPWLERMCELGGCHLPLRRDPGAIMLKDRDVRSHPRVASALLINATIVNDAGFAQPYPHLELVLSDTAGNVVASRVFRAEEYLGRPLAPGESMPVGVPIHITLELADPGKSAVGFAFEFR